MRRFVTAVEQFDAAIIGSGPGGYVAAIKAAQLGLRVACIERTKTLGGTCLNVGCIPSKSLLHNSHLFHQAKHELRQRGILFDQVSLDLAAMQRHKEQAVGALTKGIEMLFKKNKVVRFIGHGRIESPNEIVIEPDDGGQQPKDGIMDGQSTGTKASNEGTKRIEAKNIVIATGSEPVGLKGVEIDECQIVTSTGALSFSQVPKHLVVVGGGIIGLELGTVWNLLGAQVTVIESLEFIGGSAIDRGISDSFAKILQKQGMKFLLGAKVSSIHKGKEEINVKLEGRDGSICCDKVLVCVGRKPYTQGLGLEGLGVELDSKGRIKVNEKFETNVPSIRAIGDVIAGPMLAHKAEEEGIACMELIAGLNGHVNYNAIPSVVYTFPEVAWVGTTQQNLDERKVPYKTGTFPFLANSRAKTIGESEGLVKILAHKETDQLLGVHIIGPNASEMIAEATLALSYGASSEDLWRTCHAHPTFSEALKEACMSTSNKPIHF